MGHSTQLIHWPIQLHVAKLQCAVNTRYWLMRTLPVVVGLCQEAHSGTSSSTQCIPIAVIEEDASSPHASPRSPAHAFLCHLTLPRPWTTPLNTNSTKRSTIMWLSSRRVGRGLKSGLVLGNQTRQGFGL